MHGSESWHGSVERMGVEEQLLRGGVDGRDHGRV